MKKFIIPFALFAILSLVACDNRGDVRLTLQSKIASQYPGAIILDNDKEIYGLYEVEIIHDNRKKEVYYNRQLNWRYTKWEISILELPLEVTKKVTEAYPNYYIKDAAQVESPGSNYYEVEIEKGNIEKDLKVSPTGEILGII